MKHLILLLFTITLAGCDRSPDVSQSPDGEADTSMDQPGKHSISEIPRGKTTRYGLFRERGRGWVQKKEGSSTGKVIRNAKLEFTETTDRIPLHKGVYFGYQYWLKFPPDQARPSYRRILIHPEMTLPDGSRVTRSERTTGKRATHGIVTAIDGYTLSEDYELVEGDWTFQLWHKDNLLVEQKFTTYWPEKESSE